MKFVLKTAFLLFTLMLYFAFAPLSQVSAQTTITVETNDPAINADSLCSLREAVENANANGQPHTDCPAGTGADTINLDGRTIIFTEAPAAYDAYGHNALRISRSVTIENGTIERDSNLTNCDGGEDDRTEFRLITAARNSLNMHLNNLTLRNGCASDVDANSNSDDDGGTLFFIGNGSVLYLNNVHVEDSQAIESGGVVFTQDTIVVSNSSFVNNTGNEAFYLQVNGILEIVNTTITGSSHNAIRNRNSAGTTTITNSTISGNGNRAILLNSGNIAVINNTILSNNGSGNCAATGATFDGSQSNYSYSDDAACNFSTNNGADNATITLGSLTQASNGTYYYPLLGGDALNSGDNSLIPTESSLGVDVDGDGTISSTAIDVDQIGNNRVAYGVVDAGATEAVCSVYSSPYSVGTVQSNLVDDLRQAINCANSNSTADTIDLNGQTVTISDTAPVAYDADGYNGLPSITTDITLTNGTIERSNTLASCVSGDNREKFRLVHVSNSGDLTLNGVTLENGCAFNTASIEAGSGGGILNNGGLITVANSHFEGNSADFFGGAISTTGQYSIVNSSFVNNAGSTASAIYTFSTGDSYLVNSTVSGNTGDWAIYVSGNSLNGATDHFINNTISGNTGLNAVYAENTPTVAMYNNIIDHSTTACAIFATITESNNYQSDSSCGFTSNVATSVTLDSLTQDSNGTFYYPLTDGTAIDGGSDSFLPDESTLNIDVDADGLDSPMDTDQIGNNRVQGASVDVGSYESTDPCEGYTFPYTIGAVNANLVDDLRQAIECANGNLTDDTIDLGFQTVTFSDSAGDYSGATALPGITSNITLRDGTLDSSAQNYRFLHVAGTGTLFIAEVTLQNGGESTLYGGAVYVDTGGTLNIRNSTFTGFIADRAGAIWSLGTVSIVGSTFDNNSVTFNGGAFIGNTDNQATIVNSTFANNHADNEGGAIHTGNDSISIDLYNVTITGNTANGAGGGINRDGGAINVYNSIISGNSATLFRECSGNYDTSTAQNSILGYDGSISGCNFGTASNNVTAAGNLSTIFETDGNGDPLLADNGGNTRTIALITGSPAINAGDNSLLLADTLDTDRDADTTEIIDSDQRDDVRISLSIVDAGAYEIQGCEAYSYPYTVGTLQNNLVDDLRQAINCTSGSGTANTIDLNGQTVTFSDSAVDFNGATALPVIFGNDLTLKNGTLDSSSQSYRYLYVAGTATLTLDTMTLQNAGESAIYGGAIYLDTNGTLNVRNSTFTGFIADRAGAIWSLGNVTIAGSTFNNNSVAFNGGAFIGNTDNQATIVNSTFANNQANNDGGAIHISSTASTTSLINVTIAGNSAGNVGGGINRNMSGVFNIDNSIISGNTAASFLDCAGNLSSSSARNSVFGDNGQNRGCGFGTASNNVTVQGDISTVFETSAGIPVLANNGGNTQTVALVAGSPAINAGDNNLLPADVLDADGDSNITEIIEVDQAGEPRIENVTVDAGAVEFEVNCSLYIFPYTPGTNFSSLDMDLRTAMDCANQNATDDTIDLNGQTVVFSDSYEDANGPSALPNVTTGITLKNGALDSTSQTYRFLHVAAGGALTLDEMTLHNAGNNSINGGAVFVNTTGELNVRNSTFSSNVASRAGAIWSLGTVNIVGSTFNGNSASLNGGALLGNDGNNMTVVNTTLYGNQANYGGAVHSGNGNSTTTLINTTITNNTADDRGGGITRDAGTINIHNTIVSGNNASGFLDCRLASGAGIALNSVYGDSGVARGCDFGGASANNVTVAGDVSTVFEVNSSGVPVLASNGGSTRTVNLAPASVAAHAGDNNLLPVDILDTDGDNNTAETIDIDQAGRVRIILDRVDAGAYEGEACASYSFPYTVGTLQSNLQEDLRQAINCAEANGVPDVINLADDIEMTTRANDQSAFQQIDTTITINGNGFTLARDLDRGCGGAGLPFRFFRVGSNGDLRLNDIRLHKGCARSNSTLYGGAILVLEGNLYANNITFDENRATARGGAIDAQGANIFIANSLFINNAVSSTSGSAYTGVGGAISYNNSTGQGMLTVVNTTFVNNYAGSSSEAGSGSAIYIYFADSGTDLQNLTNVTVVGNQNGPGNTGAIAVKDNSELNIYNSIISGNSSDCTFEGSPVVNAFNNVFGINGDASGCTGFNNAGGNVVAPGNLASIIATNGGGDPLLANNGGLTRTIALIAGSPAVNAGDTQYLPGEGSLGMDIDGDGNSDHPIDVDQRGAGFGRVFGYSVDAGAFEYRGVDVSGDGIVSPVDAVYVINRVGTGDLSADVDGDNDVDNDDVLAIQNSLGTTP